MKIVHVSDTHIGFSAYRKVDDETGINQREMDIYRRFAEFADKAIEIHPDLVIHSGDLFDSVRPSNRAISVALDNLARITAAGHTGGRHSRQPFHAPVEGDRQRVQDPGARARAEGGL